MLCEREWLDFGHKFEDRCGIGEESSEKCPVFLQWLDCVHNIYLQFPCAFEFSKRYLVRKGRRDETCLIKKIQIHSKEAILSNL